jgi:hypothetical protein
LAPLVILLRLGGESAEKVKRDPCRTLPAPLLAAADKCEQKDWNIGVGGAVSVCWLFEVGDQEDGDVAETMLTLRLLRARAPVGDQEWVPLLFAWAPVVAASTGCGAIGDL